MQLTQIKSNTISKSPIRVDNRSVFMIWPDNNQKIWSVVYNCNLYLSNCKGIIVPNKIWTIYKKKYNGKHHYLDVRKNIMENNDVTKKIRVLANLPGNEIQHSEIKEKSIIKRDSSEFYFYDLSMIAEAAQDLIDKKVSEKILYTTILSEISKIYQSIKANDPNINVELLVDFESSEGVLFKMFHNFKRLNTVFIKTFFESNSIFDSWCFVTTPSSIFPILTKENNEIVSIPQSINRINSLAELLDFSKEIDGETVIDQKLKSETSIENQPAPSILTNVVNALANPSKFKMAEVDEPTIKQTERFQKKTIDIATAIKPKEFLDITGKDLLTKEIKSPVVEKPKLPSQPLKIKAEVKDDDLSVKIDGRALSKVLKAFKITNPDIVANVKVALEKYLHETGTKISSDKAEEIVLKAIHYTIHNTDIVDPKYLRSPGALISKLSQMDVYKKSLEFPKPVNLHSVDPSKIVSLKYTTGQHRQRFEFTELIHENVKKVLEALETQPNHPIKLEDLTWDYVDTESDRFIQYTAKLKNIDGINNKIPYNIQIKVPTTVNDKYFKLGGNYYVFSTQQHMKPITKTDKNEVRILTNYAIVRVGVQNLKFNTSDISDIIDYLNRKYPNLIDSVKNDIITFKDGDKIYLTGNILYTTSDRKIIIDEDTNKLKDEKTGKELNFNKYEYIYDIILKKIHIIDPNDQLTKTKKSIPYIHIFLSGTKMPLIIYMWSQKGLLPTLTTFGIDYEIVNQQPSKGEISLPLANGGWLLIQPKTVRERLIVNGLLVSRVKDPIKDLNSREEIKPHLIETYGSRASYNVDNMTQNLIDPVTKDLLRFENLPTNLPSLLSEYALDVLLNRQPDSLSDLKIYRSRMSEVVLRLMYKQLCDTFLTEKVKHIRII